MVCKLQYDHGALYMLTVSPGKIVCIAICVLITLTLSFTIDMTAILLGVPIFSGHAVGYVIASIVIMLTFFHASSSIIRFLIGSIILGLIVVFRILFEVNLVEEYLELIYPGVFGPDYALGVMIYSLISLLVCLLPLCISIIFFELANSPFFGAPDDGLERFRVTFRVSLHQEPCVGDGVRMY